MTVHDMSSWHRRIMQPRHPSNPNKLLTSASSLKINYIDQRGNLTRPRVTKKTHPIKHLLLLKPEEIATFSLIHTAAIPYN